MGRGPGEAGHSAPPWPSSHTSLRLSPPLPLPPPPPVLSPASSSGSSVVGWLSPTVLAPPGLVGVKEALAEEQGVQGHVLQQQQPMALLRRWGSFQLKTWGEGGGG